MTAPARGPPRRAGAGLLRERSEGPFELGEGTVYPALYRLERRRLLASSWEAVAGRRRRVYRLIAEPAACMTGFAMFGRAGGIRR